MEFLSNIWSVVWPWSAPAPEEEPKHEEDDEEEEYDYEEEAPGDLSVTFDERIDFLREQTRKITHPVFPMSLQQRRDMLEQEFHERELDEEDWGDQYEDWEDVATRHRRARGIRGYSKYGVKKRFKLSEHQQRYWRPSLHSQDDEKELTKDRSVPRCAMRAFG